MYYKTIGIFYYRVGYFVFHIFCFVVSSSFIYLLIYLFTYFFKNSLYIYNIIYASPRIAFFPSNNKFPFESSCNNFPPNIMEFTDNLLLLSTYNISLS